MLTVSDRAPAASLCLAVEHVVGLGADPQVRWVDAAGHVAGMADDKAIRNPAVQRLPHGPVRVDYAMTANPDPAVSVTRRAL